MTALLASFVILVLAGTIPLVHARLQREQDELDTAELPRDWDRR